MLTNWCHQTYTELAIRRSYLKCSNTCWLRPRLRLKRRKCVSVDLLTSMHFPSLYPPPFHYISPSIPLPLYLPFNPQISILGKLSNVLISPIYRPRYVKLKRIFTNWVFVFTSSGQSSCVQDMKCVQSRGKQTEWRLWEGSSKHCWNIFSNARL